MISRKLRIFIAEDEAIILRRFMDKVRSMGHEVVGTALHGLDAEKGIDQKEPDMVLIDINMPGKDGLTVVRETCAPKQIPAIIITGHYSEELMERANHECVFAYLMKPVDHQQLEAAINVAWSKYEQYLDTCAEAKQLKENLANRIIVERAKGILMDSFGLKESEAMNRLQKMSKDKNKKLVNIAKEIVEKAKLLGM